jgi:hypothetical protein
LSPFSGGNIALFQVRTHMPAGFVPVFRLLRV